MSFCKLMYTVGGKIGRKGCLLKRGKVGLSHFNVYTKGGTSRNPGVNTTEATNYCGLRREGQVGRRKHMDILEGPAVGRGPSGRMQKSYRQPEILSEELVGVRESWT